MKLTIVAGARPNFVKIAPIIAAIEAEKLTGKDIMYRLVHTGQHYDAKMSASFFEQLNIPNPDVNLGCTGATQSEQVASILIAFEKELLEHPTDLVLVVGDVNSTMACTIVAKKLQIKVAHVEAGIRSYDWSMPEEINRVITDRIADYFFTTTPLASENLMKEGVANEKVFFVGNVMVDTLLQNKKRFLQPEVFAQKKLEQKKYMVLTLHRPANVDEENNIKNILEEIATNSNGLPIVFPVHPRTKKQLDKLGDFPEHLIMIPPLSYLEFNYLVENSFAVVTDSGGITEETTMMGIPCITLRDNTERPETITLGTNELIGTAPENIQPTFQKLFAGNWKKGTVPELWDGKTSERIVNIISEQFQEKRTLY
ncbi:non-hydrolyzing UDP-N-acetylglucosamine 2-epimerase [Flavicella marina]|uniref:non-hydrolyzing UDP-N-acetylglucosamine 2-epimerase n=1 Tax=Flavicella marina TaxID=1475951 RepID=UPI00126505C4|nr:UDP-N-acetylglucosamine 2-epimerase (non-hydrolyzing) [Flavicella marina]